MAGRRQTKETPLFGQRLSSLRKERGITQAELAEALEISGKMVDYYERRCANPSMEFVKRAAAFFNVGVGYLVSDGDAASGPKKKRPGPRSRLDEQVERIRELPRSKQRFISEMLDTVLETAERT